MRRLMVVSSGSWERSIVGRNALGRLLAGRAAGVFEEVDYVFFPAGVRAFREPAEGFRVHEIPGRPDPSVESDWTGRWRGLLDGWREIDGIASARRPAAIGAVEPFLSGVMAREVAFRRRIPLVVTVVSNYRLSWQVAGLNPIPFFPPWLTFLVERWILSSADRVHADCDHYAGYARRRGARPQRVRRIPRYADPAFYEREPDPGIWDRLGVPDPTPVVYVGRLSPEKYALDLADAFLRIRAERPESHLVIVGGGGPDEERFEASLRAAGATDRMHVRQGLDREAILSVMGSAGVVLAPHAGYALLEAGLAGAAVVAYDYEWHPELVRDGVTGRLVPYRDPVAMARAALDLLGSPGEARRMGRRLRTLARSEYRLRDHVEALERSYRDLFPGAGR